MHVPYSVASSRVSCQFSNAPKKCLTALPAIALFGVYRERSLPIIRLEGNSKTPAARVVAGEFLFNPDDIAPCFPDLESLEVQSLQNFKAKVKAGISVAKGTMDFDFQIADRVPPSSAKLNGKESSELALVVAGNRLTDLEPRAGIEPATFACLFLVTKAALVAVSYLYQAEPPGLATAAVRAIAN
jgi:hypothetical protein